MKTKNRFLTFGLILTSVFSGLFANAAFAQQTAPAAADTEYQIGAVLYMQKAAEYRALAYQAFNLAKMRLDADERDRKKLAKAERKKPRAVIVDVDETMLDNSPAQAYGAKNRIPFNLKSWYEWGEMRKAKAIPGAVDFANYAKAKNVKIFYITNRDEVQKKATIDNLKAAGFPDVTEENVFLRTTESGKEPRRQMVRDKNYRIVLLIGDNLNDFTSAFEKKSVADRFAETDKAKEDWGTKFIVLPNAMYGDWESAIYEYQRLTEQQKAEKRANALELP